MSNKYRKRRLSSTAIRNTQKLKTSKIFQAHQIGNNPIVSSTGKNMEQEELSYTLLVGDWIGTSILLNNFVIPRLQLTYVSHILMFPISCDMFYRSLHNDVNTIFICINEGQEKAVFVMFYFLKNIMQIKHLL